MFKESVLGLGQNKRKSLCTKMSIENYLLSSIQVQFAIGETR